MIHPAVAVDKYQTVAFDSNRYSVPRPFAFRMVTVKGYVDRVVIVGAAARSSRHMCDRFDEADDGPRPDSITWRRWAASPARWTTRRSSATGSCPPASPTSGPSWSGTTARWPAPAGSRGSCNCSASIP